MQRAKRGRSSFPNASAYPTSESKLDEDILGLVACELLDGRDPVAEFFQRAEGARADIDQDRGITLRETASNLGRDLSMVSLAVKRLAEKMREDRKLQRVDVLAMEEISVAFKDLGRLLLGLNLRRRA